MADTKTSALPAAGSFLLADELPVNEAGTSKKVTGTQIAAAIVANLSGHLVSTLSGTPTITNKGANVTSVTVTGNDTRGKMVIVMAGVLAGGTRIATVTFAASYGASSPGLIQLVNATADGTLALVNFYVSATSTGVSFDFAGAQALAAGTYTLTYLVIA